jgi:hypothetical protein
LGGGVGVIAVIAATVVVVAIVIAVAAVKISKHRASTSPPPRPSMINPVYASPSNSKDFVTIEGTLDGPHDLAI